MNQHSFCILVRYNCISLKFAILYLVIISISPKLLAQKIAIKDTIYLTQCDTGSQGIMTHDLDQIKNTVFFGSGKAISPTVYISTASGGVIKITDIAKNPTIQNVCRLNGYSWTDIAINKDKELYLSTPTSIQKLDTTNCTAQTFYTNTGQYMVALSFDTKNNLYFSDNTSVYRFNNSTGSPIIWKDFGTGTASGDFVMKNGKMYISWEYGGMVDLFEVTVDNSINYISHQNKCRLKSKTYGLASELGELYGVTPGELYKIDETNCKYTTIISNTSGIPWYGAAGFHEAQNSASVHLNYADAVALSNPLSGLWTNTIPFQQVIYVSINDKIKDSLFIYPVKISIESIKRTIVDKTICKGSSYEGYNVSGSYTNTYKTKVGCDSIHTLNLKVVDTVYESMNVSICQGESYKTYTNSGTYTESIKTGAGCDSIWTLNLTVTPTSASTLYKTICMGKTFLGKKNSGIYMDTFQNLQGCDSIRTLHLTVVTIPKPIIDTYACIIPNQRYRFFSQIISGPGNYIDSTNHAEDCDTIFKLHVSLQIPQSDSAISTRCQGYIFKGMEINADTSILDTLRSKMGCDSVYRTYRFHIQKLFQTKPIVRYYCDTFHFDNAIFITDTLLVDSVHYSQAPYCDSLRQIYIYRMAPKPIVSIYTPSGNYLIRGESLRLNAMGAIRYLWSTHQTSSNIDIKPNSVGNYTYWLKGWNEYDCMDTAEVEIEVEDLVYLDLPTAFSPNGDGVNDMWTINASGEYHVHTLDIFNRWGEKVFAGKGQHDGWDGNYKGKSQNTGVFTYYLLVEKNRKLYEKKGSFTLIR